MTSRLTLLTIFLFTFNLSNIHAQDLDTVTICGRIMDQNGAVSGRRDSSEADQDGSHAHDKL
jgi:hypothetical protein